MNIGKVILFIHYIQMKKEEGKMKCRKKPVEVEAFKWTGDLEQAEDPMWVIEAIKSGKIYFEDVRIASVTMKIKTLEGVMTARHGDYIIRGIAGEIYPCKPDIFERTYDIIN